MRGDQHSSSRWIARAFYLGGFVLVGALSAWLLWPVGVITAPSPPPPLARSQPTPRAEAPVEELVRAAEPVAPTTPAPLEPGATPRLPLPRPVKHMVSPERAAQEAALLARARAEVVDDPQLALKTLLERSQTFPDEQTAQAELVQLEALLRLGRREEAQALARRLAASPLKREAQRLLETVQAH